VNDLRYSLRSLLANPGMTVAAVLTLALGIGANTAIFSGVNGIFLNPAPGVARAGELVEVYARGPGGTIDMSSPEYRDYRDRNDVFSGLAAYQFFPSILTEGDANERIWSLLASANYFDLLGVRAVAGRLLAPADDDGGGQPVIVISYGLWQRRFAGRSDIAGTVVGINGHAFTIVGVAPAEFRGTFPGLVFDAWIPMANEDRLIEPGHSENRRIRGLSVLGRLDDGVNAAEAEGRLQVVAQDLSRTYPAYSGGLSAAVFPLSQSPRGPSALVGPLITVVMGIMGLLLLMTCANVANLLLARASARQREIAVRLALGASRWQLTRQLLIESLLLSAMGGLAGVGVGYWTAEWLYGFLPEIDAPLDLEVRIDQTVLLFAMAITAAAAVVFGLLQARHAARADLVSAVKDGGLGSVGAPSKSRLRNTLVVVQMALSLVLLVAAGLFVRSMRNAQAIDPGFTPRGVLIGTVFLPSPAYDATRATQYFQQLGERVAQLPDVRAASITSRAPLGMGGSGLTGITVEDYTPERDERPWSYSLTISPMYFQTLQVPVIGGRDFRTQDEASGPLVIIVNQPFADQYWPGRNPLGRRVLVEDQWRTVVGLVHGFMTRRIGEAPAPVVFLPIAQNPRFYMTLMVRTSYDSTELAPTVRRIVQEIDPQLPLYAVQTLERHIEGATFAQRAAASMLTLFGGLALVLAAVGTYGVVAYNVSQRTRELGVRMALGAQPRHIVRLIMGGGAAMVGLGVIVGMAGALAVARVLAPLLINVSSADYAALGWGVVLLTMSALAACYLPARRAMRVDPNVALRHD
jgi:macrolide transport system ATP-binding/permease protein